MPPQQQRVALVTGASRGVGWGVATALQQQGWRVYGTSRHGNGPDGTVALTVDHTDDDAVAAAFAHIVDDTGRLDLLVNNAWASPPGFAGFTAKFYERPVSDWDSLIGIGLRSHYVAAVQAAQIMVPQGSGLIASTSSFGSRGHLHSVLYGVGKTGVDKMAYDMGAELAGTGVALGLLPGGTGNLPPEAPEAQAFSSANVDFAAFQAFLAARGLGSPLFAR